jgi:glycosyltransferase involved in cell wall biosynthesis
VEDTSGSFVSFWTRIRNRLPARSFAVVSFIIPAHNEEALIGRTVAAIHAAARAAGGPYEIVVADDASTDRTADLARAQGARVVGLSRRRIAAARNAGARAAAGVAPGDVLLFVDADTAVTPAAVRGALAALARGAVGGGACVRFDQGPLPLYARVLERLLPPLLRATGTAPGCFLFCTRGAYRAAGGFDEAMDWAEEVAFARRLKQQGRFVILPQFVITSARKLRAHSAAGLLRVGLRLVLAGRDPDRRRKAVEYWYGPR